MKRKAIVLFEVMIAVLISVIISVFLFRAFGKFAGVGRKSMRYMDSISYAEKLIWDWQLIEEIDEFTLDTAKSGFDGNKFKWDVELTADEESSLAKLRLNVGVEDHKTTLDVFRYFTLAAEEN